MSSPASSPESLPPPENASPPSPRPLLNPVIPPMPVIVSSPLLSPPAPEITPPPAPPPLPEPSPVDSPPPESLPLISPPAPAVSVSPPATTPTLPTTPPPIIPEFPKKPPAPPLKKSPAPVKKSPAPALPIPSKKLPPPSPVPVNPPPSTSPPPATTPAPELPKKSPAPQKEHSPPRSSSVPASSGRSKTLPTPASPPPTGDGSTTEVMPLTAEMPSPEPSIGGTRPAMAVLPVGANGSSDIQADTAGGGAAVGGGVSTGIVAGLCVGGVVLVALLVFGILVVLCRRKKGCGEDDCGGSFSCNSKADFQGKFSLPSYTKRHTNFPEPQIWGATSNNNGSGSTTSGSTTALVSVPLAVPSSGTFSYEELVAATNGFSEPNLLGQGGFGFVHKGVLPNGKEVAVKKLKMGGQQGEREFRAEVDTISQVHHKHLVSLVGYCIAGVERLLVYEFVANKTMEFHLHEKDQPVMEWSTRLKIAIGSAKGLAYLHEDCNPTIIHRDIKASNILLDFNYEVKVADFGLARIFSNTNSSVTHVTTRVVGTFGYLAPEYASSGKVTDKSDVYSYGVMLLELITGRPPINISESSVNGSLVNWARPLLPQAIEEGNFERLVDPRLQNNYNVDEMANMVACAAACVRLTGWRRPRMSQVILALEGDLSPADLDDGVRLGHSSLHLPYESLDFDARKYMEDMRKLRMTLSSNAQSDNTSEYGLQPSISSADSHELYTRSFEPGRN